MSDAAFGWYGGYAALVVKRKGIDCLISNPKTDTWVLRIGQNAYGPFPTFKAAKAAIKKVI